jgi:hypothetical protein
MERDNSLVFGFWSITDVVFFELTPVLRCSYLRGGNFAESCELKPCCGA